MHAHNHASAHVANHLQILFDRLEEHGLVIHDKKCEFGVEEIVFLGHLVDKHGIRPMPSKVEAINNYPEPTNAKDPVKAMERFLGMWNYYHRFVPNAAQVLKPLYNAIVDAEKPLPKKSSSSF